ncbi:glycosyl hydrolase family 20, catalytic domain protein, partial [Ancylostoma caninum]
SPTAQNSKICVIFIAFQYFYTNIIVHFDLKGAPPRLSYFLQLLELVAKAGATGVLIEWEDMFPWSGALRSVRNTDAYTEKEVQTILEKAALLDLEVIPLVQTFGHMEWILKYEKFRKFRENDEYPQVICIGDDKAVDIVREAIRQVVRIHRPYGIRHFHIGADEAFEYGTCAASKKKEEELGSLDEVAIHHMAKIASYVKKVTKGATILAWHDMLKNFASSDMEKMNLISLVEPVVWDYSEQLQTADSFLLSSMADNFGKVWASSAFKGADFPSAKFLRYKHYQKNNIEWIIRQRLLRKGPKETNIEGVIITGWSRYDHMAGLCEIWPVAEPSMFLNTQIALIGAHKTLEGLSKEEISAKAELRVFKAMECSPNYAFVTSDCKFPGGGVSELFQTRLKRQSESFEYLLENNHNIMGWLSPYNIRHNISQNWYLEKIRESLISFDDIPNTAQLIETEMLKLFYANTVEEFLFDNVDPLVNKFVYYSQGVEKLLKMRTQERRNFKIRRRT